MPHRFEYSRAHPWSERKTQEKPGQYIHLQVPPPGLIPSSSVPPMVGRRKPLVLSSTKFLVSSVLNSSRPDRDAARDDSEEPPRLHLPAGILRLPKDKEDIADLKLASLDGSAVVGLSASALKRLSITSGSLVWSSNHI